MPQKRLVAVTDKNGIRTHRWVVDHTRPARSVAPPRVPMRAKPATAETAREAGLRKALEEAERQKAAAEAAQQKASDQLFTAIFLGPDVVIAEQVGDAAAAAFRRRRETAPARKRKRDRKRKRAATERRKRRRERRAVREERAAARAAILAKFKYVRTYDGDTRSRARKIAEWIRAQIVDSTEGHLVIAVVARAQERRRRKAAA
jgi:hypothetical protein